MKKVFVTRRIPQVGIDLLKKQKNFQIKISPHDRVLTRAELLKNVKGCSSAESEQVDINHITYEISYVMYRI